MLTTLLPRLSPYQARFAGWLAVAAFVLALLLLIPAQQGQSPGPAVKSLAVVLTGAWQGDRGNSHRSRWSNP